MGFSKKQEFIEFVKQEHLLKYGDFITKSGRKTKYFFNIGGIKKGTVLKKLGEFYAQFILENSLFEPIVFGPSYKGISLAISCSIGLSEHGYESEFCYNRKEIKDHGEGGDTIGASLQGDILIIDDVITSGLSILESIKIIKRYNAIPKAVVVALDREEEHLNGGGPATEVLEQQEQIKIYSMISKSDLSL